MSAETRRREYLQALDIDVYTLRGRATEVPAEDCLQPAASSEAELDWNALREAVAGCTRCALHETRTQTVFGVGNPEADWMIVGEAPGQEEDRRGEPFVGRAGKLLDEMLRSLGLDRESVFIANILKCRPPNNRDPAADEAAACRNYLERQIDLVSPRIILAVGRIAAQQLLGTDDPVGRMRGRKHVLGDRGLPVVVTYHPAYLLRSPTQKRKAWQDLVLARRTVREGTA
jgi:DNA polymerase